MALSDNGQTAQPRAASLAVAIAIPAEGLRQWAYEDIANPKLLTVCYGSTTNVQKGVKYSPGRMQGPAGR